MSVELNCTTLNTLVSWSSAAVATGYSVQATSMNGHNSSCSEMGTSCDLNNLVCGEEYSVVVEAMHTGCPGPASAPARLVTEPCVPVNLCVHYNVSTAQVMWGAARGASSYSVQAVTDGGSTVTCSSTNTSCSLNGLQCSQMYNVTVMAQNLACNSTVTSEPYRHMTEPCPPTNVQASVACEQLTSTVSWQQSDLAVGYAAYFDNQNGHTASCVGADTDTQCVVSGMMCGTVYNVWVKALGQQYNSADSTVVSLTSAPCLPREVEVEVGCNPNGAAVVSWNATNGTANFSLTAIVSGSLQTICATQQNSCNVTGLSCGETYDLSVTASNEQCSLTASMHANITTHPCVPRNVTTYAQCEVNAGSVSWGPSDGAETYVAVATGLDGHDHECLTNSTSCTWNNLHCGEKYTVVVRAKDGNCTSLPSNSSVIHMDPCVPHNVAGTVDCDMKVVSLTWDSSNGTNLYMVTGEAGNKTIALTTNVTTAYFSDFSCGQNYSLTVTPQNQYCPGDSSVPASIHTWPCPPAGISTMQDCLSGIVMVTWQATNGSDYSTATMQTDTGISEMCMSDSSVCSIPGLTCGHNFSVSVTASNQQCNITSTQSTRLQSVPCVPTNVSAVMGCANNTAVVSWSASQGAVQYSVTAHSSHSNLKCHTFNLSCSLDNITCGNRYTVQVVAMDGQLL
ncbi:fibronectin type III domain-containing protein 7-like isoform X3 [Cottoperca gobio]|nr:fibronectin type III domain-containing protein 7-like isoform X3 [Cottoperca gobio]